MQTASSGLVGGGSLKRTSSTVDLSAALACDVPLPVTDGIGATAAHAASDFAAANPVEQ